ncbi:hypothetical protein CBS147339_8558 [Penicillium roqueforti]|uniref:Genomic scaffold, ProqFM164S01 n=1 Tax=Penicillium roqueforti (strain FM164) TaxID=1365484 RepID=W6PZK4_PENRF|nr:hypothetical protein CBS147354_8519 [Penicillium roqueforti]CDM29683.1 unnamed protein product [Penicillium roqueforti FM164]KAI3067292.1 hypothetical protein CBS147339_8558 [Penicillium roqueforti]KAI3094411.1 hypothetical protein CBS147338_6557 [Penicillium roqueforti]KAI3112710.1 hypothetical protein CBS147333_3684 [Penicillium roqueforti]
MESETLPGTRPSSSLPRQAWPRLRSLSHASQVVPAVDPSHQTNQRYQSIAEDPTAAYRATALRQLNGSPRPASRPIRVDNPSARRLSTPDRGPVLVRAYSGDAQNRSTRRSTMPSRRFLSFSSSRSSPPTRPSQSDVIFPTDKDFSIESILQAIEPDIRGTLDSIAEICGRSKLSLSNEYGSHIAPLGEICAPSSALGPVEEAGPSEERRADDSNAVIVDEDASPTDSAQDMHPFSFHRYLENLRHTASMQEQSGTLDQITQQPHSPFSPGMDSAAETIVPIAPVIPATPFTREFASRPKHNGRDLLAKNAPAGSGKQQSYQMATPAVVSEVHLEAIANDGSSESNILPQSALGGESSGPEITQSLIGWLKWAATIAGPESSPALQSAESRLRAMLDRSGN